jgi:hypothetical protein
MSDTGLTPRSRMSCCRSESSQRARPGTTSTKPRRESMSCRASLTVSRTTTAAAPQLEASGSALQNRVVSGSEGVPRRVELRATKWKQQRLLNRPELHVRADDREALAPAISERVSLDLGLERPRMTTPVRGGRDRRDTTDGDRERDAPVVAGPDHHRRMLHSRDRRLRCGFAPGWASVAHSNGPAIPALAGETPTLRAWQRTRPKDS